MPAQKPSIAVLISGRGSNLESLIKNSHQYSVIAVLANNKTAGGLKIASVNGIQTYGFERGEFATLKEQKAAIYSKIRELKPDLVALAGFMQIVEPEFVKEWTGKLINIHPSLLPALPGLDTHHRAVQEKLKVHGCTVHFVDSGVDTGPIIAQASVAVESTDTEDSLAARVLPREHAIYPWVVNSIALKNIKFENGKVIYTKTARAEAAEQDFILPE